MVKPPIVTLSVPTEPEAPEPSPYVICQVEPSVFWKVLDCVGLKTSWAPAEFKVSCDSWVDQHQRSELPVSKSKFKVCPGVPMVTGAVYEESF